MAPVIEKKNHVILPFRTRMVEWGVLLLFADVCKQHNKQLCVGLYRCRCSMESVRGNAAAAGIIDHRWKVIQDVHAQTNSIMSCNRHHNGRDYASCKPGNNAQAVKRRLMHTVALRRRSPKRSLYSEPRSIWFKSPNVFGTHVSFLHGVLNRTHSTEEVALCDLPSPYCC